MFLINLLIKLFMPICGMLGSSYRKVRLLLPASILTMSIFNRKSLKRKFDEISKKMSVFSYADAARKGLPPNSVSSGGGNSRQVNNSRQVTSGRDDRKNEQPNTSSYQRQPNNRGGASGNQGTHYQQNCKFSDNAGRSSNNQNWSKAGKGGGIKKGFKGNDRASNESYNNRNQYSDKRNWKYEEQERSFDHNRQRQDSYRNTAATNTAQRSRQNSESKDNSARNSRATVMSYLLSDTTTQPSFSGTPTKASSLSGSQGVYDQENLTSVSPSTDQAAMRVPVTPVKDLSLSDPAILSVCESKEQMDSLKQSKKIPGLSGADSGADRKKTAGFKSEDTVRRNAGPDLKNTKKLESQESGKSQGVWKGVPLDQLRRAPECFSESPSSQGAANESADHSDMLKSQEPIDRIVPSYVLLPHQQTPEDFRLSSRWQNIVQILNADIFNIWGLEEALTAIAHHNPLQSPHRGRHHSPQRYPNEKLDFRALHAYFKTLNNEECERFFHSTLPKIKKLALQLPYLFQEPLPILKQRVNKEITLSQHQAACLLANAFFNTFPQRQHNQKEGRPLQMPEFNFISLYSQVKSERKVEKLKCIINYFERVTQEMPDGNVTYKRVYSHPVVWQTNEKKLSNLHVSSEGTIEDARGFLQADFANKFVGGGVLTAGLVQEEIRFVLCPEMIVSRLFTEVLASDEVLVMIGCERFNSYSGYSDTFKFTGNYFDNTERDHMGRRFTEVVAMDAAVFRENYYHQFELHHVQRELNKAYIAFESKGTRNKPAVCTGNWGCGAFGGDKQLKALIQLMAASVANRDICYLTFGDTELCLQIGHIYDILKARDICIKDIMKILKEYSHSNTSDLLFTFIEKKLAEKC